MGHRAACRVREDWRHRYQAEIGQRLLDGFSDDNWRSYRFIEDGLLLPFAALDPRNMLDEDLNSLCEEGVISATRESLIRDGAPLEGKELGRWRELVVSRAFAPECATDWTVFEVNQRGRVVYIAALVEPANERDQHPGFSFVAAYATYTETMNALKARGFTGPKDYETRSTEVLARAMP